MAERWDLKRASLRLYRETLAVKKGEHIAILDDGAQPTIVSALLAAAKEVGGKPQLVPIRADRFDSSPIPEAMPILAKCTVAIAATARSITHSPEVTQARKNGLRVASLPRIDEKLFIEAMKGDLENIRTTTRNIRRYLEGARSVWIRTPSGTNLKLNVQQRPWVVDDGDLTRPGTVSNIPFGEVYCAPRETVGQGEVVVDYWGSQIKPSHHARIYMRNGRVAEWNPAAAPLARALQAAGTCGFIIGELGVGTNPAHLKPIGNTLFDEKLYGSVHLAFGSNTSFGGKNACNVHHDVVLLKPTVAVNDVPFMDKGLFLHPNLKGKGASKK